MSQAVEYIESMKQVESSKEVGYALLIYQLLCACVPLVVQMQMCVNGGLRFVLCCEHDAHFVKLAVLLQRMTKLRKDGTELVTNIQVAADFRETQRRAQQKEATRHRLEKLEIQANGSLEKFEEISKGWDTAMQKNFTRELQEALDSQQQLCTLLLEDKDKLINDLQQELKTNYDQYKKDLKKQAQDVELLVEKMDEQIKNLSKSYRKELDLIETVFDQDRNALLSSNRKKWEQMAKERYDKELQYLLQRMKKVEEYEVLLQQLRIEDAEEYNKIKIKLDTDVQILKQELKQLKVTLQQNQEKLEYNFQVLKKREEENTITKCQQKRKINRLQDIKNNLKIRCEKQGKQSREEYKALGDDYKRIMQEYEDMQKKMRHFVTTDARTFKDIWLMNESEVKELVERALQTDRLVHEQQLAMPWVQPPLPFLEGDPTRFHGYSQRASRKKLLKSTRDDAEAAAYWEAMANIIPESKLQIWSALEMALEKYYIALNDRSKLLVETQSLQKQNMELKILLQQCISSKVRGRPSPTVGVNAV
uniref:Dynein regulatory complex protein 1 n=1 Tax=Scleropages formosus TaxID=113540 RepID=A0A8D0CIZ9_SCLFO